MRFIIKLKNIFGSKKKRATANFKPATVVPKIEMEQILPPVPILKKKHFRFSQQIMINKQKSQKKNWSKWKNR